MVIRHDIGLLGDVIPLMYNENNHSVVIFKVGDRPYINRPDEDGDFNVGAIQQPIQLLSSELMLNVVEGDLDLRTNQSERTPRLSSISEAIAMLPGC